MTTHTTRVTILDDHQGIIDGYLFRLSSVPHLEVVATISYGEEIEATLLNTPTDVLLLDIGVPTSTKNPNPYPILYEIPNLLQKYPNLYILVISMYAERSLIRGVMEAGASGYVLKDDRASIQELGTILQTVAKGGVFFSKKAHKLLFAQENLASDERLSPRQLEALSLCAAHPDWTTAQLAEKMAVAHSTVRNLLSGAYIRLDAHNRTAAIEKARQLGLITPHAPTQPVGK